MDTTLRLADEGPARTGPVSAGPAVGGGRARAATLWAAVWLLGGLSAVAGLVVPLPAPLLDGLLLGSLLLAVALLGTVVLLGGAAPRAAAGDRLAALHRALYRWALRLAGGGAAARRARSPLLQVPRFPLLLTISVLLRVALTVAALRLLLSRGEAGWVIDGVTALAGQDPRVALALLLLCGAAQYLVLARGGERAAEVAARFALDALPGRQAAIEADLRAGALSPLQARRQRGALITEAQRYGALDGALRLLRGDVIGGLLALALALLFGAWLGATRDGLSLLDALSRATAQAAGLGLTTQLPVVLTAAAALLLLSGGARAERSAGSRRAAPPTPSPDEALGVDQVQALLDEVQHRRPLLVRETIPRLLSLAQLTALARQLVADGQQPLPLPAVLEALVSQEGLPRAPGEPLQVEALAESLRLGLGAALLPPAAPRPLPVLTLDADMEELLRESLRGPAGREVLALEPELAQELQAAVAAGRRHAPGAVVLCPRPARRALQRLLALPDPDAASDDPEADPPRALAHEELPPRWPVRLAGRLTPGGFRAVLPRDDDDDDDDRQPQSRAGSRDRGDP